MSHNDLDQLWKFFVMSEKGLKEGGGDQHSIGADTIAREDWRERHWVHPYSIYRAFCCGLIDTEVWVNGNTDVKDSAVKLMGMVKSAVVSAYPKTVKVSLSEIHRTLKLWSMGSEFQDYADDLGVDPALVVDNAILTLRRDMDLTSQKLEAFMADDFETTESKAS